MIYLAQLKMAISRKFNRTLPKGISLNVCWSYKGDEGTLLHIAALFGHLELVNFLISAGADVNAQTSPKSQTPLHYATCRGHVKVVQKLLEAGANPNQCDKNGVTALLTAMLIHGQDYLKMIKMLLTAGADCTGYMPLKYAAPDGSNVSYISYVQYAKDMGFTELVELFIAFGADPNVSYTTNPSLHSCC